MVPRPQIRAVARQRDQALFWPGRFDRDKPSQHTVAIAQGAVFNNHSWDLWTQMWQGIAYRRSILPGENPDELSPRLLFERDVSARIPLNREQTPEDIGNLAAFLASDYSINITGQSINVDGGSRMN